MQTLPDRNNTSFPKLLYEVFKKIPKDKDDPLQYHQRLVLEYLMKYPHIRGLLAYHQMGSGKTILAASICEEVIERHPDYKILFVASKSLHSNFVEEGIKKYRRLRAEKAKQPPPTEEELDKHVKEHYELISSNASNMLAQVYRTKKPEEGDVFADWNPEENTAKLQKKIKSDMEKIGNLGNLNKTFVVIEEAHNFFNAVTNGSQNAVGLYEMIMNAEEIKLLMLTGSPIVNDPFEFAVAANMLAGYLKGPGVPKQTTLFGEDYEDFLRYFVHHAEALDLEDTSDEPTAGEDKKSKLKMPSIQNKEKFTNRITGLVSYYGTDQGDIQKLFPHQLDPIIRRVPMSTPQYAMYASARDKEQEESKRGVFRGSKKPLQKSQGSSVSSYRVRSRQFSNFIYPKYASKSYRDERGHVHYETYIDKIKSESLDYHAQVKKTKGRKLEEEDEMQWGIETWSPKMVQMMADISQHLPKGMLDEFRGLVNKEELKHRKHIVTGPGIVYSQFLDAGIAVFGKVLEHYGFMEIKDAADLTKKSKYPKGSFAIISGEVPTDVRAELIKLYNSPENRHGEIISLLLITATGAEGISTKGCTHVHVMEPYWHWARLAQVFARAVRLLSHEHLPEKDRYVQPYIYLSDYPLVFEDQEQQKMKIVEDTTDVHLLHKAMQNQMIINSFLRAIQEASIDCMIHYGDGAKRSKDSASNKATELKCKVCAPTDEPLFLPELDKDIRAPSNCRPIQEKVIKVEKIILKDENGEREFSFMRDDKDVVHLFEYDIKLNGHKEIFEDHPDYLTLIEKIEKKRPTKKKK